MIVVYRDKDTQSTFNTNKDNFELVRTKLMNGGLGIKLRLANTYIDCPDPVAEFENILAAIEKHQQVYWIKYESA